MKNLSDSWTFLSFATGRILKDVPSDAGTRRILISSKENCSCFSVSRLAYCSLGSVFYLVKGYQIMGKFLLHIALLMVKMGLSK